LNLFIQEVTDLFHHGNCINLFFRVLTKVYENVKQLIHMGHVEVPGHHKVTASPVVLTKKWMNVFNAVHTMRSIAKMT
jgi:hypothetical protein